MNKAPWSIGFILILLLGSTHAATPIAYARDISVAMSITADAAMPVTLSAGPDGATLISANRTSSASTLNATPSERSFNTTALAHSGDGDIRVRLVHIETTGEIVGCIVCQLELRGGSTSRQISILNGHLTRASGDWVTMHADHETAAQLWVHVKVLATGATDMKTTIRYALEIIPAGSGSPNIQYRELRASFTL